MTPEERLAIMNGMQELLRKQKAHVRVIEILTEEMIRIAEKDTAHADEILAAVKRAKIALHIRV